MRDQDDKYAKIKQQENVARSRGWVASLLLVVAIAMVLLIREGGDIHRAKHNAATYLHLVEMEADKVIYGGGETLLRGSSTVVPARGKPEIAEDQQSNAVADLEKLEEAVVRLDAEVRRIKADLGDGHFMEIDPTGLDASMRLQEATRKLLAARYGSDEIYRYRVKIELQFQSSMPDFEENGAYGTIMLELAPSRLQPHSIYTFMEVCNKFKKSAFHRRASHVLQAFVRGHGVQHLAFQEYSPEYPHKEGTVGYAGRPSGPEWYVSIQDNSRAHGPGTQQKYNPHEADSCFGKVIQGYDDAVQRVRKMPGDGFINDNLKHILIKRMQIQVADPGGNYADWSPKL